MSILVGKSKIFYVPAVTASAAGNFKLGLELENEMDEHYWKLDLVENGRQLLNEIPILGNKVFIFQYENLVKHSLKHCDIYFKAGLDVTHPLLDPLSKIARIFNNF